MHRPVRTRILLAALLLQLSSVSIAAQLAGRQVSEVLDDLRRQGVTFIYNTDLIPDSLRVQAEPAARMPVEAARQILSAHGLTLTQVAPRMFAVVRAPAATSTATRAAQAEPAQRVEEVVVHASRYAVAQSVDTSHTFLDQVQVTNLPRLGDETLQAIQRLPGAAANGFSSLGPIRGGLVNETAIVLDGLRLYEPFHLKSYLSPVSLLDSRIVDGIDVYFGGFPAIYGDRMSAIIDARTIRPAIGRYYELGLTLFHASALASMAFDDDAGSVLLSARRSNLGELAQFAENDIGKPQYADGFARIAYELNESTRGSVSALVSNDKVDAIRSAGAETARDESSNGYVWLNIEHDWSDALASRGTLSWTDVRNSREGQVAQPGIREGTVDDTRTFSVIGLRLDNRWRTGALQHRFGAEVRRLWADYEYDAHVQFSAAYPFVDPMATQLDRSERLYPDGFEASGYWDARFMPSAAWTLEGGLRVDTQTYDGSGDAEQWGPRASVLYQPGANTRLRASWGRFYQSQGINELQVEDGVTRFNPAQHAIHSIVSVEHTFAGALDARLELYRKDYRRVSPRFENLFDPTQLLPELAFDRVRIEPDSARAQGIEFSLNWHPQSAWSGWLSYSWARTEDRIDGRDEYRSWDQRHSISAGLAWTQGPWAFTVANAYHSGWPTTELSLTSATPPALVVGPRNAARYDAFNSFDMRLTRSFALPRGQLDVFLEATNAFSRENPCCTEYILGTAEDGTPTLNVATDNWLPLVPSFGVLWRYGKL